VNSGGIFHKLVSSVPAKFIVRIRVMAGSLSENSVYEQSAFMWWNNEEINSIAYQKPCPCSVIFQILSVTSAYLRVLMTASGCTSINAHMNQYQYYIVVADLIDVGVKLKL
jgi:hypothetical protein